MKILQINTVYGHGSTGRLVSQLQQHSRAMGMDALAACRAPEGQAGVLEISGAGNSRIHGLLARYTMHKGCFSWFRTRRFLKKVQKYQPDLIHLHNLHGSYVHIGLLMGFIKKGNIPVVMTLHDCWAFTAICAHFSMANCEKWKTGCGGCPQRRRYSRCPVDLTARVWELKRKWFAGVQNLTVVTPSRWLASLAEQSFLRGYPVRVIPNGIDLRVFAPVASDFKRRYEIDKMVLAVADGWSEAKGLDALAALAAMLPWDYRLVVLGVDTQTKTVLPEQVLALPRTRNQMELAALYAAADVFINPTREESFGLVNLEALACGTPVVSFRTGGCPEILDDTCGSVVAVDDVQAMNREVVRICETKPYSPGACRRRAMEFDQNRMLEAYLTLYQHMGGCSE